MSRIILEPWFRRAMVIADYAQAEAIRAELDARTWQHDNPWNGWTVDPNGKLTRNSRP